MFLRDRAMFERELACSLRLTVISEPSLRSRRTVKIERKFISVYTIRSECKHCV